MCSGNTATAHCYYDLYDDCNDTFYIQPIYFNEGGSCEVLVSICTERTWRPPAPLKLTGMAGKTESL